MDLPTTFTPDEADESAEPDGCDICGGPLTDDREQRRRTCWACVVNDPDNYGA